MSTLSYKTVSANKQTVQKEWVLVDAEGQTVGRLATRVANILRGKTKPCYTPHVDCGDNVIIINAEKVVFSGKKETDKIYQRYTGYPGGQRETTPAKVRATHPERILEHAIRGMLPKNRLGDALYRNLYVYAGSEHPHQGQNPGLDSTCCLGQGPHTLRSPQDPLWGSCPLPSLGRPDVGSPPPAQTEEQGPVGTGCAPPPPHTAQTHLQMFPKTGQG